MQRLRSIFLLFFLTVFFISFSQDKNTLLIPDSVIHSVDKLGTFINASVPTQEKKIIVIYNWITKSIEYDVDNMFAINRDSDPKEIVNKVMATRKAMCQGYAELFCALCTKCNIPCFSIGGFTKQSGFVDYIPHMWNVAKTDSVYKIYDVTWGAGGVSNNKFVKHPNAKFFENSPIESIKTHMPFDPIWQLLYHPFTQDDFYKQKIKENKNNPYFNYPDSILVFSRQDKIRSNEASLKRIEQNGIKNTLSYEWFSYLNRETDYLKRKAEHEKKEAVLKKFNSSVENYNLTSNMFNDYIQFKNKQFTPTKPDAEIKKMMTDMAVALNISKEGLLEAKAQDSTLVDGNKSMQKMMDNLQARIAEESKFVEKYISTKKMGRKALFYTRLPIGGLNK